MNEEELWIEEEAHAYIKAHSKELIAYFAPPDVCHRVRNPVSLFMAGSPGAGKTEISKSFMSRFQDRPIRIDADDIRTFCSGYTGTNAHLFQKAATKGVHILYDYALKEGINCILDGTFAYAGAQLNIERSIDAGRRVELWFVYQNPLLAWDFTKAREIREARHVSKDVFIEAFITSRNNAISAKNRFGKAIELNLLLKDYEEGIEDINLNISAVELDRATGDSYSEETLRQTLL
jgi:UDP-N-acetylglucosamine kinase